MLAKSDEKRFTTKEVLEHPWFSAGSHRQATLDTKTSLTDKSSAIYKRLQTFSKMPDIQKALFQLVCNALPHDAIAVAGKQFQAIDLDNSGKITLDELAKAFSDLGVATQAIPELFHNLGNFLNISFKLY